MNYIILGELSSAVRKSDLRFGVYYSLLEWFNPLFLKDKANHFTTNLYSSNKVKLELHELLKNINQKLFGLMVNGKQKTVIGNLQNF